MKGWIISLYGEERYIKKLTEEKFGVKLKKEKELKTEIDTYTDCIATIEAELGRLKNE